MAPQRRDRVGEACAIHVHPQVTSPGERGDRLDLVDRVDGTDFRGLRERHHLGLREVDIGAPVDDGLDGVGCQLAVVLVSARGQQLRTVGEELGATALVGLDVRQLVANHGVIRLRQRCQCQRIRRGAVEDEEYVAVRIEQLSDAIAHPLRPGVVAVCNLVTAGIRLDQIMHRLGANPGVVVRRKVLRGL